MCLLYIFHKVWKNSIPSFQGTEFIELIKRFNRAHMFLTIFKNKQYKIHLDKCNCKQKYDNRYTSTCSYNKLLPNYLTARKQRAVVNGNEQMTVLNPGFPKVISGAHLFLMIINDSEKTIIMIRKDNSNDSEKNIQNIKE